MASTHVVIVPFPCQGHVIPLMELSHSLVEHGFKVTFVNTEFNHLRVLQALPNKGSNLKGINLVSIPDGLRPGEDRNDLGLLAEGFTKVMPGHLEDLIRENNEKGEDKIKWLIADQNMGWSFPVAKKMGVRIACFWPASTACLTIMMLIPKLIEDGVLDEKGWPKRDEIFQIAPKMPPIHTSQLSWNEIGDPRGQPTIFKLVTDNNKYLELAKVTVCNSFYEIESGAYTLFPNLLPIGPLLPDSKFEKSLGLFWPEDSTCMNWLDEQPQKSVIYVAFGSFTIFSEVQFKELAHGLVLTGRPFLWVVRPDFTTGLSKEWVDEFLETNKEKCRIVSWAPQQQVLAHGSVACFMSHCGWNSTLEGVRNGLPFLCWPYFTDQFINQSYICNVWRNGLKMEADESGIVSRERVRDRVKELLASEEIATRVQELKESAGRSLSIGGTTYQNFKRFVNLMMKE
ncbi:UDP-glycosyltransferase 83A1 [Rhynchospora pubera]|uniref:UDP-glycosyltransferase 83A1 n=1 Tax=Rhynchospora pubera TaxID=906938 RepID=A0AAV8H8M7_9POAL|nr:UDP-glycosyltransferase 83A1 [Rhynchospora pubera]